MIDLEVSLGSWIRNNSKPFPAQGLSRVRMIFVIGLSSGQEYLGETVSPKLGIRWSGKQIMIK
jgi:hypothetical protein